jgi:hypothetical protein
MSSKKSQGVLKEKRRVGVSKKDLKKEGFAYNPIIPEGQPFFKPNKVDTTLSIPYDDEQGIRKTKLLRQFKAKIPNPKGKGKPVLLKELVKQMTTGRLYLFNPEAGKILNVVDGKSIYEGKYEELSEEMYNSIVEHVGDKNGDIGTIYNPFLDDSNPDRFYANNPTLGAEKAKVEKARLALKKEEDEKSAIKRGKRKAKFPEKYASDDDDDAEEILSGGGGGAAAEPEPEPEKSIRSTTVQNTDYNDGKTYKEGDLVEIDDKFYLLDEEFRPYIMDGDDFGEYLEFNVKIVQYGGEYDTYSVFPQDVGGSEEEIIIDMNTGKSIGDNPDQTPTPIREGVLRKIGYTFDDDDDVPIDVEEVKRPSDGKVFYRDKEGKYYDIDTSFPVSAEEFQDDVPIDSVPTIVVERRSDGKEFYQDKEGKYYDIDTYDEVSAEEVEERVPPKLELSKPKKVPTKVETTSTSTMTEIMEIAIKAAVSASISTQTAPPPEPEPEPEPEVRTIIRQSQNSWKPSDFESKVPEDSLKHYNELLKRDDGGEFNIYPVKFDNDPKVSLIRLDSVSAGREAIDAGVPEDTFILVQLNGEIYLAEKDEDGDYVYAGEEGEEDDFEIIGIDNLLANIPEERWRYGDGDPTNDPQRFRFNFEVKKKVGFPQSQ